MCGIFSYIYNLHNTNDVNSYYDIKVLENFNNLKKRGPDNSQCVLENNIFLGFHRLSINDITTAGNQPMNLNNY